MNVPTAGMTVTEQIFVDVTFDASRGGYVGLSPELQAPVVALSLAGLRRQVEKAMLNKVVVVLQLDKAARLERDRRRLTGRPRPGFAGTSA